MQADQLAVPDLPDLVDSAAHRAVFPALTAAGVDQKVDVVPESGPQHLLEVGGAHSSPGLQVGAAHVDHDGDGVFTVSKQLGVLISGAGGHGGVQTAGVGLELPAGGGAASVEAAQEGGPAGALPVLELLGSGGGLSAAGGGLGLLAALLPRTAEQTVGIVVLGMVLCEVFSACALTLLFQRHWKRFPPSPARDQVSRRRLFAIALPVGATSLLGNLLNCANSVLIPAKLVEGGMALSDAMSEFGVLCGMTLPLLGLPTGFIGALCLVMVPDLSRRTAQGDRRAAAGFLDRVMSSTSLLMAPAMALLTVIGPSMGRAMFQDDRVGTLILPLAAGMLLGCWQSVLSGALNGLGLQNKAARSAIVSDAAQLAFTFFAVPKWGLPGFAAGFVVSGIVGAGMNLASVLRAAGLRPRLFRWFVRPVLAAVFMGLWCNLLFRVMLDAGCHQGWTALVCAILGLVLYAAALLAQGLSVNVVFAWFGSCFKQKGRAL